MTFEEFLEKCRDLNGWYLEGGWRVRRRGLYGSECPLTAAANVDGSHFRLGELDEAAETLGVKGWYGIMKAADGNEPPEWLFPLIRLRHGRRRKALLGLVKP